MNWTTKIQTFFFWILLILYVVLNFGLGINFNINDLIICIYLFILGTVAMITHQNITQSVHYFLLTIFTGLSLLSLNHSIKFLNLFEKFYISIYPITFIFLIHSFIKWQNHNKNQNYLLWGFSLSLSFISTISNTTISYIIFFILYLLSGFYTYNLVESTRHIFYNSRQRKILSYSIIFHHLLFCLHFSSHFLTRHFYLGIWELFPWKLVFIILPTSIFYVLIRKSFSLLKEFILLLTCSLTIYSASTFLIQTSYYDQTHYNWLLLISFIYIILPFVIYILILMNESKYVKKQQKLLSHHQHTIVSQLEFSNFTFAIIEMIHEKLLELPNVQKVSTLSQEKERWSYLTHDKILSINEIHKSINPVNREGIIKEKSKLFFYLRVTDFQIQNNLWILVELTNYKENTLTFSRIKSLINKHTSLLQSIQQLAFSFSELNQPYIRTNKKIEEKLFERINQEKRQFANFLHDNILQSIISLNNLSSTLHGDYRIKNLIQIEFAKLTYSIRKQITDQTPSSIYLLPLETNLNILFEDLHGRFPDINFQLHFTLEKELPEHSIPVVFRIIRELNLNIAKHSSATLGQTSLKINDNCLEIRVLDNGIGIKNIQQLKQNLIQKGSHFGLLTIKNDIALLGGHFSIQTTPTIKQGTEIIINIPIELEV